jgi:transposase-like protein
MECKYCRSTKYIKNGTRISGVQIYTCKVCHRNFRSKYKTVDLSKRVPCVKCGSTNTNKDGFHKGKQRFWCKDCGRCFQESYMGERLEEREPAAPCIFCGSIKTQRKGKTEHQVQKRYCNDCGRFFQDEYTSMPQNSVLETAREIKFGG